MKCSGKSDLWLCIKWSYVLKGIFLRRRSKSHGIQLEYYFMQTFSWFYAAGGMQSSCTCNKLMAANSFDIGLFQRTLISEISLNSNKKGMKENLNNHQAKVDLDHIVRMAALGQIAPLQHLWLAVTVVVVILLAATTPALEITECSGLGKMTIEGKLLENYILLNILKQRVDSYYIQYCRRETYHFPMVPIFGSSGSGQNNNSIPTNDPDTQSGFMQEK